MLEPTQLEVGDTVEVEFINAYKDADDPDPSSYDWHVDEIEAVTEEVVVEEATEEDEEDEVEELAVATYVQLTWAGGEDESGTPKRLAFDHETGRWRIERQPNESWNRWNVEEQIDVREAEVDEE